MQSDISKSVPFRTKGRVAPPEVWLLFGTPEVWGAAAGGGGGGGMEQFRELWEKIQVLIKWEGPSSPSLSDNDGGTEYIATPSARQLPWPLPRGPVGLLMLVVARALRQTTPFPAVNPLCTSAPSPLAGTRIEFHAASATATGSGDGF